MKLTRRKYIIIIYFVRGQLLGPVLLLRDSFSLSSQQSLPTVPLWRPIRMSTISIHRNKEEVYTRPSQVAQSSRRRRSRWYKYSKSYASNPSIHPSLGGDNVTKPLSLSLLSCCCRSKSVKRRARAMCSCEQRGNVFVVNSHRPSVRVPFKIFVFFFFIYFWTERREREDNLWRHPPRKVFFELNEMNNINGMKHQREREWESTYLIIHSQKSGGRQMDGRRCCNWETLAIGSKDHPRLIFFSYISLSRAESKT